VTWQPKPVHSLRGRAIHFSIGGALPAVCGAVWGYPAACWGAVGAVILGTAWEALTPRLAKPCGWSWPHGDAIDLAAWYVGAGVGLAAFALL
jgi:hypothetical protein